MNAEFFTCAQCRVTFPKGSPDHGLSGYCCQCEISLGILKIHESDEDNEREMRVTKAVIAQYRLAFPDGPGPGPVGKPGPVGNPLDPGEGYVLCDRNDPRASHYFAAPGI